MLLFYVPVVASGDNFLTSSLPMWFYNLQGILMVFLIFIRLKEPLLLGKIR